MSVPKYDEMMNPLLEALHQLGGSGTIAEINEKTFEIMGLSEDILSIPHKANSSMSRVEYNLAWTRTYLKKYGLLENSSRGVWALTNMGDKPTVVDLLKVVTKVREEDGKKKVDTIEVATPAEVVEGGEIASWEEELKSILLSLHPDQFERLAQRILRECGFTQVEVIGKSGDGGIDGKGLIKIGGLISFHAMFQCKRFQQSVTASHIRDFRGALLGRADKGLFITTGSFTRDAVKEAHRDGASPIDLIDGNDLVQKLKELSLGVKIEVIEQVTIDKDWFSRI